MHLITDEEVDYLYDSTLVSFSFNLIPRPESIINVYKEVCIAYPEISGNNPLELWDLRFVRGLLHKKQRNLILQGELIHSPCSI